MFCHFFIVLAVFVVFVFVLRCLAIGLVEAEMDVVVVVVETAEEVDTTEVLHDIMIGIMKGII